MLRTVEAGSSQNQETVPYTETGGIAGSIIGGVVGALAAVIILLLAGSYYCFAHPPKGGPTRWQSFEREHLKPLEHRVVQTLEEQRSRFRERWQRFMQRSSSKEIKPQLAGADYERYLEQRPLRTPRPPRTPEEEDAWLQSRAVQHTFPNTTPLGMYLKQAGGYVFVQGVIPNLQAHQAGVQAGSIILGIDRGFGWTDLAGVSCDGIIAQIEQSPRPFTVAMLPPLAQAHHLNLTDLHNFRINFLGRLSNQAVVASPAPAGREAAAALTEAVTSPKPLLRPKAEKQGTNMKKLIDSMLEEAAVAEEVAEEVEWDAQLSTNRAMLATRNEGQSAAEAEARRVRELTMITRSLQSMLEEQRKELRWRSEFEYNMRQAIAWAFNLLIIAIAYFFSIIFALKFQEVAMRNMALTWVIAYGVTFAIVEPVQVLVIAVFPSLMNSDTSVGRFCGRCRFVYNELCAP